jgi:hypothetical protein
MRLLGGLEIQLIYYRGPYECSHSPWLIDGQAMARMMAKVMCQVGHTQIAKALKHVREEHQREAIHAVVVVGDAMEEDHNVLCDAAAGLNVPLFMFQEGAAAHSRAGSGFTPE